MPTSQRRNRTRLHAAPHYQRPGPVERALAGEWRCTEGAAHQRILDAKRRLLRKAEISARYPAHLNTTAWVPLFIAELQNTVDAAGIPEDVDELMRTAFAADQLEDHGEHETLLEAKGDIANASPRQLRRWLNALLRQHETTWLQVRWVLFRLEQMGETAA